MATKRRLTKKVIEAEPLPQSGKTVLKDSEFPNLCLAVYASGKRSWHLYYRTKDRKQRNPKLGSYPALTVDGARTLARQWQADVSRGSDPMAARKESKKRRIVAEFTNWFVTHHMEKRLKPTTQEEYLRILDKHIVPSLGKMKLDDVTPEIVQKLHHGMRDTPRQANLTVAILRKMFNEAIRLGWRTEPRNPAQHIGKYRENQRRRYLSKAELPRLWSVLEAAAQSSNPTDGILALQLLLLTGRRKSEILNLTWEELDLDRRRMTLHDSKVGAMDYELSPEVVTLLKGVRDARARELQMTGLPTSERGRSISAGDVSGHVIRGRKPGSHLVGLQRIWDRVRKEAGIADVRLHDLRHSYASIAIDAGVGLAEVKELLGHTTVQTTQRYAHLFIERKREAAAAVEKGIMRIVSGGRPASV